MTNPLAIPAPVAAKLNELVAIVEENPVYIPLPRVAALLGMDAEGLRNSIEKGNCPFGLAWQKTIGGYKSFKIPTVPFYLWYTQAAGFRSLEVS